MKYKILVIVFVCIILLSGCSILFGTSTREKLPSSGRWEQKDTGVIVDFDNKTFEIDGKVYDLGTSDPEFLDCTATNRAHSGYCVEVNENAFCIELHAQRRGFGFTE